ncbi:hypothetical protein PT974_01941 [Cladobotryum mycophilum]|uniref:NACHT domain-containing protein n=1 Tax=Cladobotryum mycophilum TaxID=491253 RepID=A0ABR0SX61_9HYPO
MEGTMQTIAAVGLAGNIAQFSEHAIAVVSRTIEISQSNRPSPKEKQHMEDAMTDMKDIISRVKASNQDASNLAKDRTLEDLAVECISLSNEDSKWQLVRKHTQLRPITIQKRELKDLASRLQDIQNGVSAHLLGILREEKELGQTLRIFVDSTEALQKEITASIDDMIQCLIKITRHKPNDQNVATKDKRSWMKLSAKAQEEEAPLHVHVQVSQKHSSLIASLQIMVDDYTERMGSLVEKKHEAILQQLHFNLLKERESSIMDAHEKTFNWIFRNDSNINLADWFQRNNEVDGSSGIYWVAGKAGSGKSTLMKFLRQHPTTTKYLRQWASTCDLIIADYYFWSLGTTIQKSQEGLFRSLLIQILGTRPNLMPVVMANRWSAPYSESFSHWSHSELLQALLVIGTLQFPPLRVCLFIDGLDESSDNHQELLQALWGIGKCPNYKICVSSREWPDFSNAFKSSPWKLHLQDLTNRDIEQYIRDTLEEDAQFRRLQGRDKGATLQLVSLIKGKAHGVFLWVFLVVRSLIRGLRSEDTITDLQQRLDDLPSDLLAYFGHILDEVEDVYKKRAVRLFLTMSYAESSFPLLTFYFLNLEDEPMSTEPLPFLRNWPDVNTVEAEALAVKKRQLIAQCRDLIRISPESESHVLFSERVGFLHRTVSDYLCTTTIRSKLFDVAGADFDPKKFSFQHLWGKFGHPESAWLDDLEAIIMQNFSKWGFSDAMHSLIAMPQITNFVELASKFDLLTYVEEKLYPCDTATLDQKTPEWRKPCFIQQPANLQIFQKGGDDMNLTWRLGAKYRPKPFVGGNGGKQLVRNNTDSSIAVPSRRKRLMAKVRGTFSREISREVESATSANRRPTAPRYSDVSSVEYDSEVRRPTGLVR